MRTSSLCNTVYVYSIGKSKNLGLSSQQRHMEACVKRPQSPAQHSLSVNNSMTKFVTVKRGLSKQFQEELKRAETRFIVGGQHSLLSVEQSGFLELAQTCIKIGIQFGAVNVNEIWFGRKTVKETCVSELSEFHEKMEIIIKAANDKNEVSCTTDLWTDSQQLRTFLDFTVFWI